MYNVKTIGSFPFRFILWYELNNSLIHSEHNSKVSKLYVNKQNKSIRRNTSDVNQTSFVFDNAQGSVQYQPCWLIIIEQWLKKEIMAIITFWNRILKPHCEATFWNHILKPYFGATFWNLKPHFEATFQKSGLVKGLLLPLFLEYHDYWLLISNQSFHCGNSRYFSRNFDI